MHKYLALARQELLRRTSLYLVIALSLAVYAHTYRGEFIVLDDPLHLLENPALLRGELSKFWTASYRGMYIPVTYTVWGIEKFLSDIFIGPAQGHPISPLLFHLNNILLHAANTALLYLILLFFVPGFAWAAAAGALLFSLHPLQVEAVAWISGRKDLLSGFFALLSALYFLKWLVLPWPKESLRKNLTLLRHPFYLLSTLCFVLGLLSKPSVVVLPLMLGFSALVFLKRDWKRLALSLGPWLLPLLPYAFVMRTLQPWEIDIQPPSVWLRPLLAMDAVSFYLYKLTVPLLLGVDYARTPKAVIDEGYIFWTPLICAALFSFLVQLRTKLPLFLMILFLLGLLPVLGFVPFVFQQFSTVADRYLYLAMFAPALALALAVSRSRDLAPQMLVTILLSLWGGLALYQGKIWRSNLSLFQHTIRVAPRSLLAHSNIGTVYEHLGQITAAEKHYRQALEISPHFAHHYFNLGNILLKRGLVDQAQPLLEEARRRQPKLAVASYSLGKIHYERKNYAEAEKLFIETLKNDPAHFQAITLLGVMQRIKGVGDRGKKLFELALRLNPRFGPAHLGLARVFEEEKNFERAHDHYALLYRADPTNEEVRKRLLALKAQRSGESASP